MLAAWVILRHILSKNCNGVYALSHFHLHTSWLSQENYCLTELQTIQAELCETQTGCVICDPYRLRELLCIQAEWFEMNTFWVTLTATLWVIWEAYVLSDLECKRPEWLKCKRSEWFFRHLHAASEQPYTGPIFMNLSHVIHESKHLGILDSLRLHCDLQQSDDEDDEHDELLHLEILFMTPLKMFTSETAR